MAKRLPQIDVLVLGDHPCAFLASSLLARDGVQVAHSHIPGEQLENRLVSINPGLFELHATLGSLKKKLDLSPVYGLKFLADDPAISSSQSGKTISAYVTGLKHFQTCLAKVAQESKVASYDPAEFRIVRLDESGIHTVIDGTAVSAKLLILAGALPADQKQIIGLSPEWDADVMHRYTYLCLKGNKWHDLPSRPVVPMSLDLSGTLNWAWLLPAAGAVQVAVEQPLGTVHRLSPQKLLGDWIKVLVAHGALNASAANSIDCSDAVSIDLPLGGALSQEGVANRTLLIGPAGGFYSACAEDLYPNCWSAVHAVEVAKKALKERHLQDALQPYRQRWGSTLGDYLRGPQQNLRFLLPLVYRNAAMTARLSEAIFFGKSVVR